VINVDAKLKHKINLPAMRLAQQNVSRGAFRAKSVSLWQIQLHSNCPTTPNPILFGVPNARLFCKYWLLPLVWMAVIFTASSDTHSYEHSSLLVEPVLHWLFPHMPESQIHAIHEVLRKCAHVAEYSVFALLLWRAFRRPKKNDPRPWNWREAGIVLLIVALYAATDEFHQVFVATRTPRVHDVVLDTLGGAAGLFAIWLVGRWRRSW
jgi:VanZ family protein